MLVKVGELGAQVLQVGLVIERLEALENHRHIDYEGSQQRHQPEHHEQQGYLGPEFH